MNERKSYESRMQAQLDGLKAEVAELKQKARQAEINLELEYYTLVDELQVKLEVAEDRLEMLKMANEEKWEEFKSSFEHSWDALRELIKAITAP